MTGVPEEILRIGQESGRTLSDGSTGHHRAPTRFLEDLWEIGWTDGRLGRGKKEVEEIVESIKDSFPDPQATVAARALRAAEIARLEAEIDALRARAKDWDQRLAAEPMRFSVGYLGACLLAGVALLAADIAINWEMLTDAFQLKQYPWSRVLLTLGVVVLAGFPKLFFDEWVFSEAPVRPARRAATLVVTGTVIWALYVSTDVRTQYQTSVGPAAQTAPPSPAFEDALSSAYWLLNLSFSLVGGYLLALGMHIAGNRAGRKQACTWLELAVSNLRDARQVPISPAVPDPKEIVARYRAIYAHGYERGVAGQWTRWYADTLYEQGSAELRRRMALAFPSNLTRGIEVREG